MKREPEAVLEVCGLHIRRGNVVILDHVSWRVEPGQHWVILGANGSGKTSLLSALTGYLTPSGGQIAVLTVGGGLAGLISDLAPEHGLQVPNVSESVRAMLASRIGETVHVRNPFDVPGVVMREDVDRRAAVQEVGDHLRGHLGRVGGHARGGDSVVGREQDDPYPCERVRRAPAQDACRYFSGGRGNTSWGATTRLDGASRRAHPLHVVAASHVIPDQRAHGGGVARRHAGEVVLGGGSDGLK